MIIKAKLKNVDFINFPSSLICYKEQCDCRAANKNY